MHIKAVVKQIAIELIPESKLSEERVLEEVIDAGLEVLKGLREELRGESEWLHELCVDEALDRIKFVNVIDGDPIPAYQLEALKELIKKVALRKIRQLEEEQLKARSHGKKRKQAKKG